MAYLPGPFGGDAIVDVLLGIENPSGRLPFTYPKAPNAGPVPYWRKYTEPYEPQWAFGHGLHYTTFSYTNLKNLPPPKGTGLPPFFISVDVTNTGSRAGNDTVLLFGSQLFRKITPEVSMLHGYQSSGTLQPGQAVTLYFLVPIETFGYFDETNCFQLEGSFGTDPSIQFTIGDQLLNASIYYSYIWPCGGPATTNTTYTWATRKRTTAPSDVLLITFVCFCAGLVVSSVITAILKPDDEAMPTGTADRMKSE